ncbi:choline-responsive transcriptional repressor BetI [Paracoccaceae bacterium GXU_MW_L88]
MSRKTISDIRRQELVDATIRCIHAQGFSQVTMISIAKEAGSSAASINYYFGSKDHLLEYTMQLLLSRLRKALITRYARAEGPYERLLAVVEANFDDDVYTVEICAVWMQFWAVAPYVPRLARLYRINTRRVRSNLRAALADVLPEERQETVRRAIQAYMDGAWIAAAQSDLPVDAAAGRTEAKAVLDTLLGYIASRKHRR